MPIDIITAILFTATICFILGFFACSLFVSRRIREERMTCYWEGYGAANRASNAAYAAARLGDMRDGNGADAA